MSGKKAGTWNSVDWQKISYASLDVAGALSEKSASEEETSPPEKKRRPFQVISQDTLGRRVAVIDDDEGIRLYLQEVLTQQGFQVQEFSSAEQFLTELTRKEEAYSPFVDVVLCDVRLPGLDGLSLVTALKERLEGEIPKVLMTAYAEVQAAVKAMREGAYDYLEKPFDTSRLFTVLENALRYRRLSYENRFLKNIIDPDLKLEGVQSQSAAMRSVYDILKKVAAAEANVLLAGERGVGKSLLAQAIHLNSSRADMPFVFVDCATIPDLLLESELFGYALNSKIVRKGFFAKAEGGTLFLRAVENVNAGILDKILKACQEQKVRAPGSQETHPINVRVLASFNKNSNHSVTIEQENFCHLFSVVQLHIPSLRQRKEDVVALAKHFLSETKIQGVAGFTPAALTRLTNLPWRGNVHELRQVVECAAVLAEGNKLIEEWHVPIYEETDEFSEVVDTDRSYVRNLLKKNKKKSGAAKVLGMRRRGLLPRKQDENEEDNNIS